MGIRTVLLYLFGSRRAILTFAGSRWTLLVGFCFVISAAFAREYDGKDLIHEPRHIVVPAVVSTVTSFLLIGFVWVARGVRREFNLTASEKLVSEPHEASPRFFSAYLSILGLFWMTAPLAWFYAVPYERFLDPLGAGMANLATLGVVALWRVALMIRVFIVLLGLTPRAATIAVLVVADAITFVSSIFVPNALVATMGGIRVSESEKVLVVASIGVLQISCCALPILFFMSMSILSALRFDWALPIYGSYIAARPTRPLWITAVLSLTVWAFILPFTQPEQQVRRQAEELLNKRDMEGAVEFMSAHRQEDFPPHWEPPIYWGVADRVCDAFEAMEKKPAAPWVRAHFISLFRDELISWSDRNRDEGTERARAMLYALPEREAILAELESHNSKYVREVLTPFDKTKKKAAD